MQNGSKMKFIRIIFKTYPLTSICLVTIWILCLMPIPETPLSHVKMIDKWTHFVMFGGLTLMIWAEYSWHHAKIRKPSVFFYGFIAPILMGGAVEIVQATCTGGRRSGDFIDFIADAIGVCLGVIIGIPLATWISKRNKD